MSEVGTGEVQWLWEGRLPLGKVTVLSGDPGMGKTFVALDLAARVTRGEGVPPERGLGKPAGVLLLAADDDPEDTLKPRLEEAGADLERVGMIASEWGGERREERGERREGERESGVRSNEEASPQLATLNPQPSTINPPPPTFDPGPTPDDSLLSLKEDLDRLRQAARDLGDCRLIVIDPISAYLDGIDENSNVEVRRLLGDLGRLARELDAAALLVSHHRKAATKRMIHRTIGSMAFAAASRSVLTIVDDPATAGRRLLLPVKMNLLDAASGRGFVLDGGRVLWDEEPVLTTADELTALASSGLVLTDREREATDWLKELLAAGRRPGLEVQELARRRRIPHTILWRAKKAAQVQAVYEGPEHRWYWEIHEDPDPLGLREVERMLAGLTPPDFGMPGFGMPGFGLPGFGLPALPPNPIGRPGKEPR